MCRAASFYQARRASIVVQCKHAATGHKDDMSRDYGELEREFIDGLAADTGRDLPAWMSLIDGQAFAHRNDMIDWLRQQGLTFAKASRLERIHNNGGRPLYGERSPAAANEPAPPVPTPPPAVEPATSAPPAAIVPPVLVSPPAPAAPPQAPVPDQAAIATFLAKAKGYRPLAELLIRAIRHAAPQTTITVHETHLDLTTAQTYGALAVTAKDVRLALDLGDLPYAGDVKRLRLPGTPPNLTHGLVLDDARKIDTALSQLVRTAAQRGGG